MAPGADATDTIYALSSGRPPAGIAVMRVSGPGADATLGAVIAGPLPEPRRAVLRVLRDGAGEPIDRALVLRFPGPASATGEDMAELHCHGGVAVVAAVARRLRGLGLREAEAGEFTRRALFAGRLDPAEVEGLADLLAAETEVQRRDALRRSEGGLGRLAAEWGTRLRGIYAMIEAAIDYDDEVEADTAAIRSGIVAARAGLAAVLAAPPVDRLRDGFRVVFAGPVNAGKSSLFNAVVGTDAAIVSPLPGTTRDAIERPVAIDGVPLLLIDTAGLRETGDAIEAIGVARARAAAAGADIVVDCADDAADGPGRIAVTTRCDERATRPGTIGTSGVTGEGVTALCAALADRARALFPPTDLVALDARHRAGFAAAAAELDAIDGGADLLIWAEHVRTAAAQCDRLTGHDAIDAMLDTLFDRFCVGK